jgi:hypothetical protein
VDLVSPHPKKLQKTGRKKRGKSSISFGMQVQMSTIFWDIAETVRRFAGIYCFCVEGRSVSQRKKQQKQGLKLKIVTYPSAWCLLLAGSLFGLLFQPEDGSDIPPKRWAVSELHYVTTQRTVVLNSRRRENSSKLGRN